MSSAARWLPLLVTLLAPLGGLLVWLAERVWPGTAGAPYLAALGAAAVVAAFVLSLPLFAERGRAAAPGTAVWLAAPQALFVLALALYYAGRWLPAAKAPGGAGGAAGSMAGLLDWAALAFGGWVLALLAGTVLFAFVTLARLAQRGAPGQDARRIAAAGSGGLSLALLLLLVVLLYAGLARMPWEWSVAYFKITRPSEATLEVMRGLGEPIEVGVFLAADSEVAPSVRGYFAALQAAEGAGKLDVRFLDADLNPDAAEAFNARGNGWVVLRKGAVNRPLRLGEDLERARGQLRTFDRTFFARLAELSRPAAVVYLTVGHGERAERGTPAGATFSRFRTLLGERNYTVKELGLGEGLGERVPEDAALVVLAAPTEPFLATEAESLRAYLDGGGRMLAFLEPRTGGPTPHAGLPGASLEALLESYGVEFDPTVQANDRIHARRTHTKADRVLLVTVAYQDHPAMATLKRASGQFPLLLLGAGALRAGTAPAGLEVRPLVLGMAGTWGDTVQNFELDAPRESRGQPTFGLALGPKEEGGRQRGKGRPASDGPTLVAFADADLAGDLLLQNRANQQLVEDTVNWLVRREAPPGLPASEEDVRIQHATGDDWLWFYLPVLGVPALVLGAGILRVTRQRRRGGGGHA
jgi:hypothetical protein